MTKFRLVLGVVGGVALVLSSAAHSLLGWKALAAELAGIDAPADLVRALGAGWHFGGLAMLLFGLIVLRTFAGRLRGRPEAPWPATAIGLLYTVFGAGAMALAGGAFFLVFLVPGLLLLLASWNAGPDVTGPGH